MPCGCSSEMWKAVAPWLRNMAAACADEVVDGAARALAERRLGTKTSTTSRSRLFLS